MRNVTSQTFRYKEMIIRTWVDGSLVILEFRVTRHEFSVSNNDRNEEVMSYLEERPVTKDFSNYIFVDIIKTDLKDIITGYFV